MAARNRPKKISRSAPHDSTGVHPDSLLACASHAWLTATENLPPLKDWTLALKDFVHTVVKNRFYRSGEHPRLSRLLGLSR